MAIHKPTRSPRRAQLHSTSARARRNAAMKQLAGLPVYENLYALNRDFEQVLADFARLQELGMLQQRDIGNTLRVLVQEIRAWANLELVGALQPLVQGDWGQIGEILLKAARVMDKNRRKEAARKRRQKRGAASEDV
jgi:hypothetical protein